MAKAGTFDPKSLVAQREALERDIQMKASALADAESAATAAAADDAAYRAASAKVSALRAELRDQRERASRLDGIMAEVACGEQVRLVAEIETAIRQANAATGPSLRDLDRLERQEVARHEAAMERIARLRSARLELTVGGSPVTEHLARAVMTLPQIHAARELLASLGKSRDTERIDALLDAAQQAMSNARVTHTDYVAAGAASGNPDDCDATGRQIADARLKARAAFEEARGERDAYFAHAARIVLALETLLAGLARKPNDGPRGAPFGSPESDRLLRDQPNSGRALPA